MSEGTGTPSGRLPDFIIIGTQKGGTTSLWHYLRAHPGVFMPELKEPNFFITEGNWKLGINWYRSLFSGATDAQVCGEASPGYTMFPTFAGAPGRIAEHVPKARLIYILREPVARMVSNWGQSRADFQEWRPVQKSLISDMRYSTLSLYATQLEQYLEHFDREQLLIIRSEDLSTDPESTMRQVCAHVGIDSTLLGSFDERHNTSESRMLPKRRTIMVRDGLVRLKQPRLANWLTTRSPDKFTHSAGVGSGPTLDPEFKQKMTEYFQIEMVRLREIVGPELDLWGYA